MEKQSSTSTYSSTDKRISCERCMHYGALMKFNTIAYPCSKCKSSCLNKFKPKVSKKKN